MTEKINKRIVHVQTIMLESDLEALKKKTKEPYGKDALAVAVAAYLAKPEKVAGA